VEGEPSRGPIIMTRICWRSVDILSRMLSADEREAVRGDLAESGVTGSQALLDVLSLVIRRQAALWAHWRPWLTLMGLVIPLGMLLSVISRRAAGLSAVYIWMYANNWDWNLLEYRGLRYQFAQSFEEMFLVYLTLVCGSWTSGFVLGSASRGIIRLNSVRFASCCRSEESSVRHCISHSLTSTFIARLASPPSPTPTPRFSS
jgi:hypothetical protein